MSVNRPYERSEGEIIPEGVSYTETDAAYYLYVRKVNTKFSIRIRKSDLHWSNPEREQILVMKGNSSE